jgi:hypothetical protein
MANKRRKTTKRKNPESWAINTTEWVGYSEKHPSGTKLKVLVPLKTYASYHAAYEAAKKHADKLGQTVFLGNATPYQVSVPPSRGVGRATNPRIYQRPDGLWVLEGADGKVVKVGTKVQVAKAAGSGRVVRVMGHEVRFGSKRHQTLMQQKRHADDLLLGETGRGRSNPAGDSQDHLATSLAHRIWPVVDDGEVSSEDELQEVIHTALHGGEEVGEYGSVYPRESNPRGGYLPFHPAIPGYAYYVFQHAGMWYARIMVPGGGSEGLAGYFADPDSAYKGAYEFALNYSTKGPTEATKADNRHWSDAPKGGRKNPKRGRKGKRNPDSGSTLSDAESMFETFHGAPASEIIELTETETYESNLAVLGDLANPSADEKAAGLKVATLSGLDATLMFTSQAPKLACSPDGRQLYFVGGSQALDLASLKMDSDEWLKPSMVIGVLTQVTYQTRKGFDKFQLIDYYHELGEESGNQPFLVYDSVNRKLTVSGGQYQVQDVGIVN